MTVFPDLDETELPRTQDEQTPFRYRGSTSFLRRDIARWHVFDAASIVGTFYEPDENGMVEWIHGDGSPGAVETTWRNAVKRILSR